MMKQTKIIGRMAELGITQKDLAEYLGISPTSVNNKLTGKRKFTINEAYLTCKCLDIEFSLDNFNC